MVNDSCTKVPALQVTITFDVAVWLVTELMVPKLMFDTLMPQPATTFSETIILLVLLAACASELERRHDKVATKMAALFTFALVAERGARILALRSLFDHQCTDHH